MNDNENRPEQLPRKKKIKTKAILTVVCIMLAMVAVVAGVLAVYIRAPKRPNKTTTEPVLQESSTKPVDSTGSTGSTAEHSPSEVQPNVSDERRDGVYTFLIYASTDGMNADTIMVACIDTAEDKIGLLSIPRDTYVKTNRYLKKINGALNYGVDSLAEELSTVIGYTPDFYVGVDMEGFVTLVDKVGGVSFDVPRNMDYDDDMQELHIHLKAGQQLLNGEQAMGLLRYRHDNNASVGYSDYGRMETQQKFLIALAKKCCSLKMLMHLSELVEIYKDNVDTDLDTGELLWLAKECYAIGADNINTATLPMYSVDGSENPYYYEFISSKKALTTINQLINPFDYEITSDMVSHRSLD